jgi:hypothetical protein
MDRCASRGNAAKLSRCRESFEFGRWRGGVGDAEVIGAFDPVGVVAGAFDDAGAGPHPALGVEPFHYLGEGCCGDRGQVVRGKAAGSPVWRRTRRTVRMKLTRSGSCPASPAARHISSRIA